jgi:hypothetical protein
LEKIIKKALADAHLLTLINFGEVDGPRTRYSRRDRPDSGASNHAGFLAISYSKDLQNHGKSVRVLLG